MAKKEKLKELFNRILSDKEMTYTQLSDALMLDIDKSQTTVRRLIHEAFLFGILERTVINKKGIITVKKEPKK